ncbi:MAG: hypothetical protein AAFZ07_16545 [Actinomycetota bacterium]
MTTSQNDNDEAHDTDDYEPTGLSVTDRAELIAIKAGLEGLLDRLDAVTARIGRISEKLDRLDPDDHPGPAESA